MTKYSPEQHGTGKTDVKRHFNLHRGRWWNYYARGRWFLELGFPVEASRDLHRAIRSRSSDTRSARSYGMHFWDYFPRRELGISLFRQDRFREAIDQLQASLSSEESARAKYYLNRTRRALLERTGADARPPRIALELADGALVRGTTVVVRGTAEDDQFVRSVTVAGRTIFTEMAQRQIAFAEEVPLQPGKQTVEVTATDLVGQRTSLTITVTADLQPPTLSIDAAVVAESGHSITLDVSATDDVALREIRVGTTAVSCGGAPRRTFEGLRAELDGRKLRIMAVDTAGNVSEAEIDLPSLGLSSMPRPGGSAMLCSTGTAGGADPGDTASAPAIRLGARPPSGRLAVTDTVFFLDGKVHDPDGIAAIAVNGT
ncbi:hypothetical protein HQ560_12425, partial [bacterium]|nr:hypothetical protein [bacterium]